MTTPPTKEHWSYAEIDAMRRRLAKQWGQTIDQVTEYEARYYLRLEASNV